MQRGKKTLLNYFAKSPQNPAGRAEEEAGGCSKENVTELSAAGVVCDENKELPREVRNVAAASKHRCSGINKEWFKRFSWLTGTEKGMLCLTCIKYATKTANRDVTWVNIPCTRLRKESLADHESSKIHRDSCSHATAAALLENTGVGEIERSVSTLNNLQRDAFLGALKSMYWLAKNELPHTILYEKLLEHCKMMGCTYLNHLKVAGNATYTSERIIQELLDVLASEVRCGVLNELTNSTFFSVLCDETTDISVLKQLIVYAKFVSLKTQEVRVTFLTTNDINDGKALTITNKLIETFTVLNLGLEKLVGLGSDGAAVMIGKNNGVAKLLKEATKNVLINCHCINHRLALASAQAALEIKYLVKFNDILRQLFFFFQNSGVRMAGLHQIQNILDIPQIKLKMASDTRWLSHEAAVQSLRRTLISIVLALETEATERNDVTAEGLSKFMRTYSFVAALMMMCDVLPVLATLSKCWLRQDADLTTVNSVLEATKSRIRLLKSDPGENFKNLPIILEGEWKELNIKVDDKSVENFKQNIYHKYLSVIETHLEHRFPDMPIMSAFSAIFNPVTLKTSPQDRIDDLCDEIFSHYSKNGSPPPIDITATKAEWSVASLMLKSDSYKDMSTRNCLKKFSTNQELRESFPNLSKLATIGLTLPVSTAECERGFSSLKRIKTCLRNRMSQKNFK